MGCIPLTRPSLRCSWLDLLLNRAMLTGLCPAYVDRFARDWPRLSTTDLLSAFPYYIPLGLIAQGGGQKGPSTGYAPEATAKHTALTLDTPA